MWGKQFLRQTILLNEISTIKNKKIINKLSRFKSLPFQQTKQSRRKFKIKKFSNTKNFT